MTMWMKAFVSSAKNLAPDYTTTLSISHPHENGVITIGTRDWDDYSVESTITFSQQQAAGLVARARGHRRYYAALFTDGKAVIIKYKDGEIIEVAAVLFNYHIDATYHLLFHVVGDNLAFFVDGEAVVQGMDGDYPSGAAGFVVDEGAILADGFTVKRVTT